MTLKKLIQEAKTWSKKDQLELCRFISQNITIAIRSIYSYSDKRNEEKLEALKCINEFHHRINNIRFDIEKVIDGRDKIGLIGENAIHYAEQNQIVKSELSEVLRLSHNSMIRKIEKSKQLNLEESIFNLLDSEKFRDRIGMYIGENKLTTLKGFIDGYFYALDAMEIHLRETEPKFEKFHDWTAKYFGWKESTAGWKNIILKECNENEKEAVKLFFEVYDKFKESEKGEHKGDL